METKIIKLVTQEEIICRHDFVQNTNIHTVKNPCILIMTQDGFGAMPWMPCAQTSEGLKVKDSVVMAVADPVSEVRNEYEERFGSGLVVPTSPIGII